MSNVEFDWSNRATPSPTELAYIAGIFDGEGCVNINIKGGRYPQHSLQVSINNINLPMLHFISKYYPANIRPMRSASRRRLCWMWRVVANKAVLFLREILPYLIVKKEQALVGVEFQEKRKNFMLACGPRNQKRIPPDEILFRNTMKNRIHELNRFNQGEAYA